MSNQYAPYNQFGQANLKPGMLTSNSGVFELCTFHSNPAILVAASGLVVATNHSYRVVTTTFDGTVTSSNVFTVGAVLDNTSFHNWITGAVSPGLIITSPASVYGTSANIQAEMNHGFFYNNLGSATLTQATVVIERFQGGAPANSPLLSTNVTQFNGLNAVPAGRFLFRNTNFELNTTLYPSLPNFATRPEIKVVTVADAAIFGQFNWRAFAGISGVYNQREHGERSASQNGFMYDRVRAYRQGSILVKTSTGFNPSLALGSGLVELSPGINAGTITNVATGGTVPLPENVGIILNTRTYAGCAEIRLTSAY